MPILCTNYCSKCVRNFVAAANYLHSFYFYGLAFKTGSLALQKFFLSLFLA